MVSSGTASAIIYRAAQSAHVVAIRHPYAASCVPQTPPFNGKHPSRVDSLCSYGARLRTRPASAHLSRVIYRHSVPRVSSSFVASVVFPAPPREPDRSRSRRRLVANIVLTFCSFPLLTSFFYLFFPSDNTGTIIRQFANCTRRNARSSVDVRNERPTRRANTKRKNKPSREPVKQHTPTWASAR